MPFLHAMWLCCALPWPQPGTDDWGKSSQCLSPGNWDLVVDRQQALKAAGVAAVSRGVQHSRVEASCYPGFCPFLGLDVLLSLPVSVSINCLVASNSLQPWTVACQAPLSVEFFRQEYWRGLPSSLQGIFLTQGSNPGLPHCRQILYQLSHQRSPKGAWRVYQRRQTLKGEHMGCSRPRNWTCSSCVSCTAGRFPSPLRHLESPFRYMGKVNSEFGLPSWLDDKDSACQCRRRRRNGFNPWAGEIPWSRKWQPTPVFLPGKFHEQGAWRATSPWGRKESDEIEHVCMQTLNFMLVFQLKHRAGGWDSKRTEKQSQPHCFLECVPSGKLIVSGAACATPSLSLGTPGENSTAWKDTWLGFGGPKADWLPQASLCCRPSYQVIWEPPGLDSGLCHRCLGDLGHIQNLLEPLKPQLWITGNKYEPPFKTVISNQVS